MAEGFETRKEARAEAYRRLPYGRNIRNEYGIVIFKNEGMYYLSDTIRGTRNDTPFGEKVGLLDGKLVMKEEAYPVVELAHTHPIGDIMDNENFSHSIKNGMEQGDVAISRTFDVDVSMRVGNEIKIYRPQMGVKRSLRGVEIIPGASLCKGARCFR